MAVVRSLIMTWCFSIIPLTRPNIANTFDVRYPRVKRAQESPWVLTFDVPCKSCILAAKLGMNPNRQADRIRLNDFQKGNEFPNQFKSIPFNKVFKRRLHVKRQVPSSPGMLHVIDSIDHRYYAKRPSQVLKYISRPRKQAKKVRRIRNNYISRRRRKSRVTRPMQFLTRRPRSTRFVLLPHVTTPMVTTKRPKLTSGVTEITKTGTPYEDIFETLDESSVSSLIELELPSQVFTTPFSAKPSIDTTNVEDPTKLPESLKRITETKDAITTRTLDDASKVYMTQKPVDESTTVLLTTHDTTEMLMKTTPFPPYAFDNTIDTMPPENTPNTTVPVLGMVITKDDKIKIFAISGGSEMYTGTTVASFIGLETTELLTETSSLITTVPSTFDNTTDATLGEYITKLPEGESKSAATEKINIILPKKSGLYTKQVPLSQQEFAQALDQFERRLYNATFGKLSSICPPDRRENGISFVESGLFLYSILTALCSEVDSDTKQELETILDLDISTSEKLNIMRHILDSLPESGTDLKLRWSTRLLVNGSWTGTLSSDALNKIGIKVEQIEPTATPEQLMTSLNHKVEEDSGGAMRNTFEEDELTNGVSGVLLNTLYLRARWRSAPTLLNGTRLFRDAGSAPPRTARMIRINDFMHYAFLPEWGAEAVEIAYSTPGLSLLLLVPRGLSLRGLSQLVSAVPLSTITARMRTIRVAATLPIYTLRMTLLLPNKLQAMGISRLIDVNATKTGDLRLSHAVQRIMFWAEAGRNAFKDDGIEWDEAPQQEILVDRPYLFYVRWRNVTIMNGNFVL